MKKIIAIALSLILVLSLSVTAFATNETIESATPDTNAATAEVNGTYVAGAECPTTYFVDVEWVGLSFTYSDSDLIWDPVDHVEKENPDDAGVWTGEGTITVTNHSNAGITATATYELDEDTEADIVIDKESFNLVAAAGQEVDSNVFNVTPDEDTELTATGKIADITITITPYTPAEQGV